MKFQLKFEINKVSKQVKAKGPQKPMMQMKDAVANQARIDARKKRNKRGPGRPIKPKLWTQKEIDWLVAQPRANKSNDVRERFTKRFRKNRTLKSLQIKRRKVILQVNTYADKLE